MGKHVEQRRAKISFSFEFDIEFQFFFFTIVDVYQDWAGPTTVLEETFIKLKRQLTPNEYLNFYTGNSQNVDALSHYRGHCEPLLLFFAVELTFELFFLNRIQSLLRVTR